MSGNSYSTHGEFIKKLSKANILSRIKIYGFIECANIISFLSYVCDEETLSLPAFRYIHSKTTECLKNHATDIGRFGNTDTMHYFQDLNVLRDELEFVISLSHH